MLRLRCSVNCGQRISYMQLLLLIQNWKLALYICVMYICTLAALAVDFNATRSTYTLNIYESTKHLEETKSASFQRS